jgi:uncharacterized membrane protein YidH (DUF202 family)
MMRALDRYLGALLLFAFGFSILSIFGTWLRRGSFTFTLQGQSRVISSSDTPTAFFGYTIPFICFGALLLAWSVYAALRAYRAPDPGAFRPVGSPVAMRAMGLFFIVIIIMLAARFFRA